MLTAIVFIVILMSAVLVHELAHYLNARSVGVPVRAFSIGFGPVLWRTTWRGTEWRISLLPLGGYVDLPGMAPKVNEDGSVQHPDEGMALKTLPEKVWVLIGGVLANFALGVVLVTAAVQLEPGYREITTGAPVGVSGARIAGVADGSVAAAIGLQAGDVISSINGVRDPTPEQVIAQIRESDGLTIALLRDGRRVDTSTPWPPEGVDERPLLGIQITPVSVESVRVLTALGESAWFGLRIVPDMVTGFVRGFGGALTGSTGDDVAGPVGIVTMVNQSVQIGLAPVLMLAAIINLSLAVFNLLPIPGLDGGRMLLATVAAIRRKPFRPGQEETIHFFGVMAVLAMIVLITFNELSGLFRS
jgi:regulator of sigma E protease